MTIQFDCVRCGGEIRVDDSEAGQIVRCGQCDAKMVVPGQPADPRPAPRPRPPLMRMAEGGYDPGEPDEPGAPEAEESKPVQWVWQTADGGLLLYQTAQLPTDRCVLCDGPSDGRPFSQSRRELTSEKHLFSAMSFAFGILPALMVSLDSHALRMGLCARHRRRRTSGFAIILLAQFLGIGLLVAGVALEMIALCVACPIVMIAGLLSGLPLLRVVTVHRLDAD